MNKHLNSVELWWEEEGGIEDPDAVELAAMVLEARGQEITDSAIIGVWTEMKSRLEVQRVAGYSRRLQNARTGKEVSIEDAARLVGVTAAEYEQIENRPVNLGAARLKRLCDVFGLPVNDMCCPGDEGYGDELHELVCDAILSGRATR